MSDLHNMIIVTAFPTYVIGYLSAYTNIVAQRDGALTKDNYLHNSHRKVINAALEESLDCLRRVAKDVDYPLETLEEFIEQMTSACEEEAAKKGGDKS